MNIICFLPYSRPLSLMRATKPAIGRVEISLGSHKGAPRYFIRFPARAEQSHNTWMGVSPPPLPTSSAPAVTHPAQRVHMFSEGAVSRQHAHCHPHVLPAYPQQLVLDFHVRPVYERLCLSHSCPSKSFGLKFIPNQSDLFRNLFPRQSELIRVNQKKVFNLV